MSSSRPRTTSFADKAATSSRNCSSFNTRFNGNDDRSLTTVFATPATGNNETVEITYYDIKVIGNGSFGIVYQARIKERDELVAIKKVLQDKRFKNRELQIMKALDHCNIVKLKYYFYSSGSKKDEVYLNLMLEFIPETLYKLAKHYSKSRQSIPISFIRLYMYQLFRSLAYIHSLGICHRDIKPQNLLINQETGVLKLCDFGSAKILVKNEPNVSYICSRYYRAPELIFGAINYTTKIDIWSAGCVFAELLINQPIFPGDSSVDQLVEIIKVLGTPSRNQIYEMNPNYTEFKFPQIVAHPWAKVFRSHTPTEAVKLVSKLLEYVPSARLNPVDVCTHPFFDELRNPNMQLPSGRPLPPLFNFTEHELKHYPKFGLNRVVVQPEILNNCSSSSSANSNSSTLNAEKLLNSLTTNNNGGSNHHALTTTAAVTLASTPSTVAAPVPALVIASDATGNVLLSSQTKGIPGPHSPAVTPMGSVDLATLPETLSGNSSQTASVYTAATSGLV